MSKPHGDAAAVFKEVVPPPSVIFFETFIGSLGTRQYNFWSQRE
jgi:hypothetical protein